MKKRICKLLIMLFVLCIGLFSQVYAQNNTELDIDFNCGDKTFFHSDYVQDYTAGKYPNVSSYQKTNSITYNRFVNRYTEERENNHIIIEKTTTDDCFFDVKPENTYKKFLIRGEIRIDKLGAMCHPVYLRGPENKNSVELMRINEKGEVLNSRGSALNFKVTEGNWYKYAVAVDMDANAAYIYITSIDDTRMPLRGYSAIPTELNSIDVFRFWLNGSGTGKVTFNSLEVTGTKVLYTGTDSNMSSVFPDDTKIEEYLSDKTAIHSYSGAVFANNQKSYPTAEFENKDNELYTDYNGLNSIFGFNLEEKNDCISDNIISIFEDGTVIYNNITYSISTKPYIENNTLMIPVKALAKEILNMHIFDDNEGLIILDEEEIGLSMEDEIPEYKITVAGTHPDSVIKAINWYMAFERPTAEEILTQFKNKEVSHPRILATKKDFDFIRNNYENDAYLKSVCDKIIEYADLILDKDVLTYEIADKQRITSISQEMLDRMLKLGLAYQLTGDKKYSECAWKNLNKCASYIDWNPSHMIDVGEMNAAFAIGYDWMYDEFDDNQKRIIFEGVKKNGLVPTRLAYYGRLVHWNQWAGASNLFVKWKGNFNSIVNGGAIAASLAFMEEDEEFCSDIVEKGIRSIEYSVLGYFPDGAWIESTSYWQYCMEYLAIGIGSVISTLDTDYGIMDFEGMKESGYWYRSMESKSGNYNFHDASLVHFDYLFHPWLAKIYNDPKLYSMRRNVSEKDLNYTVFDAIWYMKDYVDLTNELPLTNIARGIESVSVRSSYNSDAMYFSAIGGAVECNHSHADSGSFIYETKGVRWISDLGKEDYNIIRDSGLGKYGAYRCRAEGHSVMVFNPNTSNLDSGQAEDGFAEIIEYIDNEKENITKFDMSSVYPDYVTSYNRTFTLDKNYFSLNITDEFTLKDTTDINWFMTASTVSGVYSVKWYDNGYFTISFASKLLYGHFEAEGADLKAETTQCKPLLGEPAMPGQNLNSRYSRIRLYENGASGTIKINVTLSPYNMLISGLTDENGNAFDVDTGYCKFKAKIMSFPGHNGVFEEQGELLAAEYDERGILTEVAKINSDGFFELDIDSDNSEIKVFMFEKNSIKPVTFMYSTKME